MKSTKLLKNLAGTLAMFCFLLIVSIIVPAEVLAAGTVAGTVISNQAYADYKDSNGNAMTRVFSNTVTTIVTQVAAIQFVPASIQQAGANGQQIVFLGQIFNTGNGGDSFIFKPVVNSGWTPTSIKVYYEPANAGTHHIFDANAEILLTPDANGFYNTSGIVQTAPDDDFDFYLVLTVPSAASAPNGSSSQILVNATSNFNNAVTAVGTYTTTVEAAAIYSTMATSPENPLPGGMVTYTITMTNNGSAAGTAATVTDILPANVTYVPGTIKFNGTLVTDAADADSASYDSALRTVTVNAGTVNPSQTVIITFLVKVNDNTLANSTITNQATVIYTAGQSQITTSTNGSTVFVASLNDLALTSSQLNKTGNPGDTVVYPFTATNTSNAPDRINFAYSSSSGMTFDIWVDSDGNGIPGTGGDYKLTDSNGDGKIDTGLLNAGAGIDLLAVSVIPAGTANGTTDTTVITGSSAATPSVTSQLTLTTSVTSPILSMVKEVSPTGAQPPGTELTYTITVTNIGSGLAKNVVATDPIPAHTSYKPNSIKTGNSKTSLISRTDADDGDGAKFDSGSNAIVVGSASQSLGANGILVFQFKVTIN